MMKYECETLRLWISVIKKSRVEIFYWGNNVGKLYRDFGKQTKEKVFDSAYTFFSFFPFLMYSRQNIISWFVNN